MVAINVAGSEKFYMRNLKLYYMVKNRVGFVDVERSELNYW